MTDNEPHDDDENKQFPRDEAQLSNSLLKDKDLNYTSPQESSMYSTSLFSRMKELLAGTIGNIKQAREFYGVYPAHLGADAEV